MHACRVVNTHAPWSFHCPPFCTDIWKRQRRDVFVYFDNDQKSAAPKDATKLQRLLVTQRREPIKSRPVVADARQRKEALA